MKATIKNLENKEVGSIELLEGIFGVKPRRDILTRMVNYQLAKRRSGNHKVKIISEVSGTASRGPRRVPAAHVKAACVHRSSAKAALSLGQLSVITPMICRRRFARWRFAWRSRPSSRQASSSFSMMPSLPATRPKALAEKFAETGLDFGLIIDGANLDANFAKAARNIKHIDVLLEQGANVYDILRRDILVLTKNAPSSSCRRD